MTPAKVRLAMASMASQTRRLASYAKNSESPDRPSTGTSPRTVKHAQTAYECSLEGREGIPLHLAARAVLREDRAKCGYRRCIHITSLKRSVSLFERLRVRPRGELAAGNPVLHRRRHAVRGRPDGSAATCEPSLR